MLSQSILPTTNRLFDFLDNIWNQHRTHTNISRLLVYTFIAGLIVAELAVRNLLPFGFHIQLFLERQ